MNERECAGSFMGEDTSSPFFHHPCMDSRLPRCVVDAENPVYALLRTKSSSITVGVDRAVLSGIMQIVTSAVRDSAPAMSSRVSREVHPHCSFPPRISHMARSARSRFPVGSASRTTLISHARWSTRQKLKWNGFCVSHLLLL